MFPFSFAFSRNDLKAGEACVSARRNSDQDQNKTNPDPYNHPAAAIQPQAAVQSRPSSAAQRAHNKDQLAEPAVRLPAAAGPPPSAPGSHKARRGAGRGRTPGVHAQGDRAEGLRAVVQRAGPRVRWSTR